MNHLELVSGESPTHGLHYWELVVDGRLLREILDASSEDPTVGAVGDNVPVLVHSWPVGLPDVFVLVGERPPELAGRIPIFVCPACGDLGCGARCPPTATINASRAGSRFPASSVVADRLSFPTRQRFALSSRSGARRRMYAVSGVRFTRIVAMDV